MFAILLSALAVAADVEPPAPKEPPRLVLVTLKGDQLVTRVTVLSTKPVQVKEKYEVNGNVRERTVTKYVTQTQVVEQAFDLKKATFSTVGGKKLDADAVKKRMTKPQVIVTSGDGKAIDEAYLKVFDKDTIVMVPEAAKK
jgi:hypothetical protein